jgi:hypothetical protein
VDLFEITCGSLLSAIFYFKVNRLRVNMVKPEQPELLFYGHNWHDLDRLVTLAKFYFTSDEVYNLDDNGLCQARAGYLVQSFRGPALDWASSQAPAATFHFDNFVTACKAHFGVVAETTTILLRGELERLKYGSDVTAFFAEFDRLTLGLGINAGETKVVMVRERLPNKIKTLLAEQALVFHDYDTMRQRLITMWALDPNRHQTGDFQPAPARQKCSACGKKGHTAPNCRSKPKN